ncbi:MAG TPA: glycosyltransferase family 2 protein [Vicinamibacterales bacterium]|nr:glycosyltransferase family 2 protein [Vicinamibacterales bacterium]
MTQPDPTDRPVPPQLSIVVPLYNEGGTVEELHRRLSVVLTGLGRTYEIIFVDDGSADQTYFTTSAIGATDPHVRIVKLARNYGQTAALAAGFDYATGGIIVSMDGDLQHEPEDLPKLLDKLAEGYDIASGWRAQRVDNFLTRRLPSKIANWMMAKLSGVELHDFGTTFKAYRAPVIKRISLYGDLHRFIPALASWQGARIAEVPIANVQGKQRASHYGLSRTWRVLADLLTVRFLLRYLTRPMHFFGPIGFGALAAGAAGGVYLVAHKLIFGESIFLLHGPLLLLSVLLLQSGVVFIGLGLLAEILTRIYLDGRHRRIYTVDQIVPEPAPARRHRPVARPH